MSGNESAPFTKRLPCEIHVFDLTNFEFVPNADGLIILERLTATFTAGQAGSVLAVEQIVQLKGVGFGMVAAILKEQTDLLSPIRRQCMLIVVAPFERGVVLVSATTINAKITGCPSQDYLLSEFLRTTQEHPSYPPRNQDITPKAHGLVLKGLLWRVGD